MYGDFEDEEEDRDERDDRELEDDPNTAAKLARNFQRFRAELDRLYPDSSGTDDDDEGSREPMQRSRSLLLEAAAADANAATSRPQQPKVMAAPQRFSVSQIIDDAGTSDEEKDEEELEDRASVSSMSEVSVSDIDMGDSDGDYGKKKFNAQEWHKNVMALIRELSKRAEVQHMHEIRRTMNKQMHKHTGDFAEMAELEKDCAQQGKYHKEASEQMETTVQSMENRFYGSLFTFQKTMGHASQRLRTKLAAKAKKKPHDIWANMKPQVPWWKKKAENRNRLFGEEPDANDEADDSAHEAGTKPMALLSAIGNQQIEISELEVKSHMVKTESRLYKDALSYIDDLRCSGSSSVQPVMTEAVEQVILSLLPGSRKSDLGSLVDLASDAGEGRRGASKKARAGSKSPNKRVAQDSMIADLQSEVDALTKQVNDCEEQIRQTPALLPGVQNMEGKKSQSRRDRRHALMNTGSSAKQQGEQSPSRNKNSASGELTKLKRKAASLEEAVNKAFAALNTMDAERTHLMLSIEKATTGTGWLPDSLQSRVDELRAKLVENLAASAAVDELTATGAANQGISAGADRTALGQSLAAAGGDADAMRKDWKGLQRQIAEQEKNFTRIAEELLSTGAIADTHDAPQSLEDGSKLLGQISAEREALDKALQQVEETASREQSTLQALLATASGGGHVSATSSATSSVAAPTSGSRPESMTGSNAVSPAPEHRPGSKNSMISSRLSSRLDNHDRQQPRGTFDEEDAGLADEKDAAGSSGSATEATGTLGRSRRGSSGTMDSDGLDGEDDPLPDRTQEDTSNRGPPGYQDLGSGKLAKTILKASLNQDELNMLLQVQSENKEVQEQIERIDRMLISMKAKRDLTEDDKGWIRRRSNLANADDEKLKAEQARIKEVRREAQQVRKEIRDRKQLFKDLDGDGAVLDLPEKATMARAVMMRTTMEELRRRRFDALERAPSAKKSKRGMSVQNLDSAPELGPEVDHRFSVAAIAEASPSPRATIAATPQSAGRPNLTDTFLKGAMLEKVKEMFKRQPPGVRIFMARRQQQLERQHSGQLRRASVPVSTQMRERPDSGPSLMVASAFPRKPSTASGQIQEQAQQFKSDEKSADRSLHGYAWRVSKLLEAKELAGLKPATPASSLGSDGESGSSDGVFPRAGNSSKSPSKVFEQVQSSLAAEQPRYEVLTRHRRSGQWNMAVGNDERQESGETEVGDELGANHDGLSPIAASSEPGGEQQSSTARGGLPRKIFRRRRSDPENGLAIEGRSAGFSPSSEADENQLLQEADRLMNHDRFHLAANSFDGGAWAPEAFEKRDGAHKASSATGTTSNVSLDAQAARASSGVQPRGFSSHPKARKPQGMSATGQSFFSDASASTHVPSRGTSSHFALPTPRFSTGGFGDGPLEIAASANKAASMRLRPSLSQETPPFTPMMTSTVSDGSNPQGRTTKPMFERQARSHSLLPQRLPQGWVPQIQETSPTMRIPEGWMPQRQQEEGHGLSPREGRATQSEQDSLTAADVVDKELGTIASAATSPAANS